MVRTRSFTRIWTLLSVIALPLALLVGYGGAVAPAPAHAVDNGLGTTPPMGWNSWNSFGQVISESLIKRQVDALVSSGMKDAGYDYVIVDGGWKTPDRDADGNLRVDRQKFPDGMPALINYVHSKGLKFGLHQPAGMTDCAKASPGTQSAPGDSYLDKARHDAALFARWQVDYIKFDLCAFRYPPNVTPQQRKDITQAAFKAMGQALRETGRPIFYSINAYAINSIESPWQWAPRVANMWRTSGDITSCWDCTGLPPWNRSVVDILDDQRASAPYAGPGQWNDPDMLEVGVDKKIVNAKPVPSDTTLSDQEARSHFSMWAMMSAPLLAGNDLTAMSEQSRRILTNRDVIALDQDPLGAQAKRVHAYSPQGSAGDGDGSSGSSGGDLPPADFRDAWDFRGQDGQQVMGQGSGTAAVLGLGDAVEAADPSWAVSPAPDSSGALPRVLSFDGKDDVVTLPGVDDLDLSHGFAFETWVFQRSRAYLPRLFERAPGMQFFVNASGGLQANVRRADGTLVKPRSNESIPLNAWTHVGLRYDVSGGEGHVRFFINGKEVTYAATGVLSGDTQLAGQGTPTYVGNRGRADRGLDGYLAYARMTAPSDALGQWQTGLFPVRTPEHGPLQVWVKPLADGDRAVTLLNESEQTERISTTAGEVGLPPAQRYQLHDLWDSHHDQTTTDEIAADVQAHGVAVFRVHPQGTPSTTIVDADDPLLHLEGRWSVDHDRWGPSHASATTVNSGSRLAFRFRGHRLAGLFDTWSVTDAPQIYVSIDGSSPKKYTVDSDRIDLTPESLAAGTHTATIAVKDVSQLSNRWLSPMQSKLTLRGFDLGAGGRLRETSEGPTVRMAFFGDSITQGVRALALDAGPDGSDGTKTYAYLTAHAFGADLEQVGFGSQGIIAPGGGDVPPAGESFAWNYGGSRADLKPQPNVVVINQGTNDHGYDSAAFRPAYLAYLRQIRQAYPHAWILAMRPFGGINLAGVVFDDKAVHAADIKADVEAMADPRIVYVDTTSWLIPEDCTDGLHPSVAGHRKAADRLISFIKRRTGLRVVNP